MDWKKNMGPLHGEINMKSTVKTQNSCSLWIESLQARNEAREKKRIKVLRQVETALETLAESYSWDAIYIFGSLAKEGRFLEKSDVDIAIKGLNKFEHFSFVGDISALIGRPVDVIRLEDCHFSDSIIYGGAR